jgi:hypothetical protein
MDYYNIIVFQANDFVQTKPFFNKMSRFNDNNLYISSSIVSIDRKSAYEHSKAIKSLQISKPNVLSAKAWIKWLSLKLFATFCS